MDRNSGSNILGHLATDKSNGREAISHHPLNGQRGR